MRRTATTGGGRRERKKLATRDALRRAALRLALRDGVENVTVERIADEADIALRTFFNYFSSKEEAVLATAALGAEAVVSRFRARPPEESVLTALRGAVLEVMDTQRSGAGPDGRDTQRSGAGPGGRDTQRSGAGPGGMDRDDVAGDEHVAVLRLIRSAPSLLPQQLSVLAAQEKALAEAITDRVATPDPAYARLCATAAFAALRVVLDRWLELAADDGTPPPAVLRTEVGEAFAMLAAGLDRGGS